MDYPKNEQGFTFISMILMISLLAMMIPLLGYTLKAVDISTNKQEIEVQQFFHFLRDDLIKAQEIQVTPSRLYLEQLEAEGRVVIKQYEDLVHRQVNGRGHEIYLRDIKNVAFSPVSYGVHVTVTTLEGETYEKTVVYYQ